jgi:integrase
MGSLNGLVIRRLAAAERPYKRADGDGLYLLVRSRPAPGGEGFEVAARLWRFDYCFDGLRKTLALGSWPDVGLLDARAARDAAKRQLQVGDDPGAARRVAKAEAEHAPQHTFAATARRWLAARAAKWGPRYTGRVTRRVEKDLLPELGAEDVGAIEPPRLLEVIRLVEDRGAIETARRVNGYAGEIFRMAIAEGRAARDPSPDIIAGLASKPEVKHRAALKATEFPVFLAALTASDEEEDTADALMLTLYTAVRTTETRFAAGAEFEALEDDAIALWRLSPARMKMRHEHLVPLSRQAAAIARRRVARHGKGLLFPRDTRSGTISENTMLYALYRLGWHSRATVHGFRGAFSTIANEAEWNRDWIERQLAHRQSGVRGAYNAAEYLPGRRRLLQWWADWVDAQAVLGRFLG